MMNTGYYNAVGGIVTQFERLDVVSNNIANANTNGFKRDDVVIGDFMRLYQEQRDILPLRNHTKEAAKFLNRSMDRVPQIVEQYSDRSLGNFEQTQNTFDFALQNKEHFFAIDTPNGVRFTRDGAFNLNSDGILVTKQGYPVLSDNYPQTNEYIQMPPNVALNVTKDGNMYIRDLENKALLNQGDILAALAIVSFENIDYLKKEGDNLYKNLKDDEISLANEQGSLIQGFLEKSNINVVKEMTTLVEVARLTDMYSNVMKTHMDDLNNTAITQLANVSA